jgi:hypothetical protein
MEFNSVDFFCCIAKVRLPTFIAILLDILGISDQNLSREAERSDRCLSCLFQLPQAIAVR